MNGTPAARLTAGEAVARWSECMRDGDFDGAWRISDALGGREECFDPALPPHLRRVWRGAPVEGRRVLVRCFHGLGDTIQFARYLPRLASLAAEVFVSPQPRLLPLLRRLRGGGAIRLVHGDPPHDLDIEVMELAHLFRTTLGTIPATVPYFDVAPLAGGSLRRDAEHALHVGLVWRGGDWDRRRSLDPALLAPLAELPGVVLHSLQHGGAGDRAPRGMLREPAPGGILGTTRLLRTLDLVVTIDTMIAHLAGALAAPVWTLLPADADWRWMRGRDDSPWYPTMRLIRQEVEGEWGGVIERVRAELITAKARRERGPVSSAPSR